MTKRVAMSLIGTLLLGMAVGLLRKADLGVDPLSAFVTGMANLFHTTYGIMYTTIFTVFLFFVFFLDKHYIGIGTFFNLFLIGTIADVSLAGFNAIYDADTMFLKVITFMLSIILLCFASSLYIVGELGVSTYDALSLIMADRKIAQYRFCRIGSDVICVILGFFLGAKLGVGTIVTAFGMGPLTQIFIENIANKIRYGKTGNSTE